MNNTFVYLISETRNNGQSPGPVKIGFAKDPVSRLNTFQTASSRPLVLLLTIGPMSPSHAENTERALHRKFRRWFIRGEWFKKGCLAQIGRIKTASYEGSIHVHNADFYDVDSLNTKRGKGWKYV